MGTSGAGISFGVTSIVVGVKRVGNSKYLKFKPARNDYIGRVILASKSTRYCSSSGWKTVVRFKSAEVSRMPQRMLTAREQRS